MIHQAMVGHERAGILTDRRERVGRRAWPLAWLLCLLLPGCIPDLPLPDSPDELDREIVGLLEDERVPGAAVALVRDGALVLERAYGYADPDTKRLNQTDTRFLVASVSKLVTGVAVMQLVEAGSLNLDEDVRPLLSFAIDHPAGVAPITTRRLLTHTAGLRDNWDVLEPLYTDGDGDLSLDGFLADYLSSGGDHYHASGNFVSTGPGAEFLYSNVGFALAAHVLEAVSGQDFPSFCQAGIFDPLGMSRTSWTLAGIPADELAVPTTWRRGFRTHAHYGFPDYPSGSLRTTAADLALFADSVLHPTGVPLSEASVDLMWEVAYPELEPTQGLAFYRWTLDGEGLIGHDGGELGASAEVAIRRGRGDLAVVLVNGEMSAEGFSDIERALFASP